MKKKLKLLSTFLSLLLIVSSGFAPLLIGRSLTIPSVEESKFVYKHDQVKNKYLEDFLSGNLEYTTLEPLQAKQLGTLATDNSNTSDSKVVSNIHAFSEQEMPEHSKEEKEEDKEEEGEDEEYDHQHNHKKDYKLEFPDKIISPPDSVADNVSKMEPVLPMNNSMIGFVSSTLANSSQMVSVTQRFTVTLPNPPTTELIKSLRFYPEAAFTTQVSGNSITVIPTKLNRNTEYVFGLKLNGICSVNYTCSQNSETWAYALRFKTHIKQHILAGYTVLGNPIIAHAYGNATGQGKSILLTGATHGEEWHAGGLWMLVGYLDSNLQEFANLNKELIIVTEINIDGANRQRATGRYNLAARLNSRGVNLNRNFPAQWQPCGNCGSGPGSEPETQAIMNLTFSENVNHTIAYHNQWPPHGIIFLGSDTNAITRNWAFWVSARTGYPVGIYNGPEVAGGGDVPGDQVVWSESVGVNGLLIEGTYRGVTDWARNFPMYLALIREF